MDCARLSDARLLPLVREGGETSLPALAELEQRHFSAVRSFASVCAVSPLAADELAVQAWRRALRLQDGGAAGAVRPHALAEVLRTAADWSETAERTALDADLLEWIESQPAVITEDSVGPALPPPGLVARAYGGLSEKSQTVLWHSAVEHDDAERIERLLGPGAGTVPLADSRARRELYDAYTGLHHDGASDECRRFHRMVLAYADEKSIDTAADLAPHLQSCAYCSRAVADLGRIRSDCGTALAGALLPWGGAEYLRSGLPVPATGGELAADEGQPGNGRLRRALAGRRGAGGRSRRADRVLRSAALVALCSFVVALAYSGALRPGAPQSSESPPPQKTSQAPPPPRPAPPTATETATATSTVTTTKPPPSSPGEPEQPPPSRPPVRGAAVEWLFDEVNGGTVRDTSGNGRNGTLVGEPPPRLLGAGALDFAGQQSVAADGPAVDTDRSFSVSAQVKLRDTGEFQTVASQDGAEISGFQLQYDPDEDRWEMRIPEQDSEDADFVEAVGDRGPARGRLTHLAGVYDDNDDEIRLYVDGRLQDTTELDGDWSADGDFVVGRALEDGSFIRGFEGPVDDVRAFRRALTPAEVRALAAAD